MPKKASKKQRKKLLKNVLIVHKLGLSSIERKAVEAVRAYMKRNDILFRTISPLEVHHGIVHNRDLIVIVGGDGTFLKAAQYVEDKTPFLCINASTKTTEGFFSTTSVKNLKKKLDTINERRAKKKELMRLCATIGRKKIEHCINEYYIGKKKPYDVAHYLLQVGKKKEQQKSSGVLLSTPAGSTAWTRGAGGKILSLTSKRHQFVVREPYQGRLVKTKMRKGILPAKTKIVLCPLSQMIIVADAIGREHIIKKNEKVIIEQSKNKIVLIE